MTLEGLLKYPLIFLLSGLISYILTPLCIKLAIALNIVDTPGTRRIHKTPVARTGGIAVFLGIHLAAAFVFYYPWTLSFSGKIDLEWWHLLLTSSSLLLVVGLLDDALEISWFVKLAGQTFAAFVMYKGGVSLNSIQGQPLPEWLDMLLTIGWFLAFINAFNLIDGLDGLASGLAAIAALGLSVAAIYRSLPTDALLLLALSGSCLGFLRYNFHPARIFLGDSGSMLIGFTLAALGLVGTSKSTTIAAIGVPFLAIGVPLFDVMLAIWRRSVKALTAKDKIAGKVVQADMEHLHHRLLKSGLTQRKVALTLYAINALLVTFALSTVIFNSRSTGIFLLAIVVGMYVVVKHLAQIELWDSGSALLNGMRRPKGKMLPALIYPLIDASLLMASLAVSVFLIFNTDSIRQFRDLYTMRLAVWCGVPFIAIAISGVYARVWSRARPSEFGILGLTLIAAFAVCLAVRLIIDPVHIMTSMLVGLTHGSLSLCLILGIRTIPRLIQDFMANAIDPREQVTQQRTLIYGAGNRAMLYLRRKSYKSANAAERKKILGFIDDEEGLRKRRVHGYLVHGSWADLTAVTDELKPTEIILTCEIPESHLRLLSEFCQGRGIVLTEWRIVEREIGGVFVEDRAKSA